MAPKVSVIVPVYNVEQYLDRCIQSLLNQTLKEIEKEIIEKMLLKYGNKSQVAKILNIDRGTLNRKLEF